jgi:hypothetical protein
VRDGAFEARPAVKLRDLFGLLKHKGKRKPVSIEEMDEAVGRVLAEDDRRIMREWRAARKK